MKKGELSFLRVGLIVASLGMLILMSFTTMSGSGSTGKTGGHEYVDLGLPSGTLWATCNVGANRPEEYGDYFAWGETTKRETGFDWPLYKWHKDLFTLTKYCTNSDDGVVDNKTELELSDDAANVNWGGNWRMPSENQINELIQYCTVVKTVLNGVEGRLLTSRTNSNSIFFPAVGRCGGSTFFNVGTSGFYWSRSLSKANNGSAQTLGFTSIDFARTFGLRVWGQPVRPVIDSK